MPGLRAHADVAELINPKRRAPSVVILARFSSRILEPAISTDGSIGKMVLTVLGMVAEMELGFIKARQRDGIERAKSKGEVYRGRKPTIDHLADTLRQLRQLRHSVPGWLRSRPQFRLKRAFAKRQKRRGPGRPMGTWPQVP
jgi:hypothetical protein